MPWIQVFITIETHIRQSFDQGDLEIRRDLRNPLLQVALKEVLEFAGKLDSSRATTDNDHMEQSFDLLGALILEGRGLATVHDALPDVLSIPDFLEEARVLLDTGNT